MTNAPVSAASPWPESVAIIGMAGRFPQCRDLRQFWERLVCGERLITTFSEQQLRAAGVPDLLIANPEYVRAGTVLEEADCFDAGFFGYSHREAEVIDPQQRVFLECAWEALEDAGYTGRTARTGVYAGAGMNTYLPLQILQNPALVAAVGPYQVMLGNDKDYLATRVAYKLDLRGPAVGVQTACSTSLAAVHMACLALLQGECDMAVAGGVSIPFPQAGYLYVPGMILSPDGYCRPFDAAAKGTVPGRGAGVVVLKRLSQALASQDPIYAVIRGSAWNNDGAGKVGYTAPSVEGQAEVIIKAQEAAGLQPRQIGFLEAHGTATELGDPIEVAALNQAFRRATAESGFCALGSVKANVGHADAAAGIAGLIKCALVLRHGVIPPNPYFTRPNPQIDLTSSPFIVNRELRSWSSTGERYAGVSSFGIGGTNVHACLSQAPSGGSRRLAKRPQSAWVVSARTQPALEQACQNLAAYVERNPELDEGAAAYTLQVGRKAMPWRRSVVCPDLRQAAAALMKQSIPQSGSASAGPPEVVFLFPGQGEQFINMGRGLFENDATFRATLTRGSDLLRPELGFDLFSLLYAGARPEPECSRQLQETRIAQPALFLLEYALAQRWNRLGVYPAAMLGHSLGELVAATVAEVFSFEDGLRLAAARGRLMQEAPVGEMLAVALPEAGVRPYLSAERWLAAENAPKLSVVAGTPAAIAELEQTLTGARIGALRLPARRAFHTSTMAAAAERFAMEVAATQRRKPQRPWLSNVTGDWITDSQAADPAYWARQITGRVRFREAAAKAIAQNRWFLEVGPGQTLLGLIRQQGVPVHGLPSLALEKHPGEDERVFLEAAARLWQGGYDINWDALYNEEERRRVPLPAYPFERRRYWVEAAAPVAHTGAAERAPVSLDRRAEISDWFYTPSWRRTASAVHSVAANERAEPPSSWLVLLDAMGFGEQLSRRLEESGFRVVRVGTGAGCAAEEDGFCVDPLQGAACKQLFAHLAASGPAPWGLLSCWAMRGSGVQTYDSHVLLLQAAAASRVHFRQIELVTDHLQQVAAEPIEAPERAEVYGVALTLPMEQPRIHCRLIDVLTTNEDNEVLVRHIAQELLTGPSNSTVAYRAGHRWVKEWEPALLQAPSRLPLRHQGTYLITGGMGGIGQTLAEYLAREYRARLVLTGRTKLPEVAGWDDWLSSHGPENEVSRRILQVRRLEQLGAEVMVYSGDVSDRAAMESMLGQAVSRFGPIHGVIHAAGTGTGGFITSLDLSSTSVVRRPKVEGSRVLADLLQGTPVDFFLLCSSISSVVPAVGLSAYAAANAFLDAFAYHCRQRYGLPALAVHFDAWREVGMAVAAATLDGMEDLKAEQLGRGILPDEGVEVFRRVLNWPQPEILVCTTELPALLKRNAGLRAEVLLAQTRDEAAIEGTGHATMQAVMDIWCEALATDQVDSQDNFFELGGHSLIGTIVLSRLRERFGVALTLRDLFESPTPASLANRLRAAQPQPVLAVAGAVSEEREEFEI